MLRYSFLSRIRLVMGAKCWLQQYFSITAIKYTTSTRYKGVFKRIWNAIWSILNRIVFENSRVGSKEITKQFHISYESTQHIWDMTRIKAGLVPQNQNFLQAWHRVKLAKGMRDAFSEHNITGNKKWVHEDVFEILCWLWSHCCTL